MDTGVLVVLDTRNVEHLLREGVTCDPATPVCVFKQRHGVKPENLLNLSMRRKRN